jgi:hypothetical protein
MIRFEPVFSASDAAAGEAADFVIATAFGRDLVDPAAAVVSDRVFFLACQALTG